MKSKFFELQESIIYRSKCLEKFYSMVLILETLTETITIKNLKHGIVKDKIFFSKYGILYIVEKVLTSAIQ